MNWLDPMGASLSLACTYYLTAAYRSAWLIGLCAIILNAILYWQKGIYGALFLELIYFVSSIYGWYQWHASQNRPTRAIRHLSIKEGVFFISLAMLGTIMIAAFLSQWTDSEVPYWDAAITAMSLIAQWLLCLKVIQCWLVWFVVDAMVASLHLYKGIPFHSIIHWIYLLLALLGYWRWQAKIST